MKRLVFPLVAASLAGVASPAVQARDARRSIGVETSISFAANGGLRNWQSGDRKAGILYVQDRTLRWYRVQMTGPCLDHTVDMQTLGYTTDATGTFDTFSRLYFSQRPNEVCGVRSIRTSLPPHGQPGAPKPAE